MKAYADSSFLLSLYSVDAHSQSAAVLMRLHQPVFCLMPFSEAEFTNAVELASSSSATPLSRSGRCEIISSPTSVPASFASTGSHLKPTFWRARSRAVTRPCSARGALDVLHVASALKLTAEAFFTFDRRRYKLARAEGLRTLP